MARAPTLLLVALFVVGNCQPPDVWGPCSCFDSSSRRCQLAQKITCEGKTDGELRQEAREWALKVKTGEREARAL